MICNTYSVIHSLLICMNNDKICMNLKSTLHEFFTACFKNTFTPHIGTMSYYGEAQNVGNRTACEQLCVEREQCGAYDWDTAFRPQCFLHGLEYLKSLYTGADSTVTQYRRVPWFVFHFILSKRLGIGVHKVREQGNMFPGTLEERAGTLSKR